MNLGRFPVLADENIDPRVVEALRDRDLDIKSVLDAGLGGKTDQQILEFALSEERIVLTHDSDFGRLSVLERKPIVGIVFLRPGDIDHGAVLQLLDAIEAMPHEVEAPFVVVAERRSNRIRTRVRRLFEG